MYQGGTLKEDLTTCSNDEKYVFDSLELVTDVHQCGKDGTGKSLDLSTGYRKVLTTSQYGVVTSLSA